MKLLPPKLSTFSSPSPTPGSGSPLVIYQSHVVSALQYNYHPIECYIELLNAQTQDKYQHVAKSLKILLMLILWRLQLV